VPVAGNGSADPHFPVGLDPSSPLAERHASHKRRILVGQPISTLGGGNRKLHTVPGVGGSLGTHGKS